MRKKEITAGLKGLGLREGDIVLLHSSLSSLGYVEGGADTVIDAFLEVLGKEGTLVVPIFGNLGIIPERVKERSEAVKSIPPSVAAVGGKAKEICKDYWEAETPNGTDTPYVRMAQMGGYVVLLGVDMDRSTTCHSAEALERMPYLSTVTQKIEIPGGKEIEKTWEYCPGPHRDLIGIDKALRESGKLRISGIGSSVVRIIKSQDLIDITRSLLARDRTAVLCDNPHCAACVRQRADIFRDTLSRESFTLVASAGLAGRYAEEIAEKCKAAGIDAVELDCLRGRPVNMHKAADLEKAVARLREDGCTVAGLRAGGVEGKFGELVAFAAEAGVPRLVAPLTHQAESAAASAREAGVAISFYNAGLGSDACSEILLALKEKGLPAGFTFNAANFARAGEKPFLKSYKKKLRRFVDALDVEDAAYDGTPQPLARGNAEIKEMISILRCASFAGHLLLGAGNRFVGSLPDAAGRFEHLLETM